MQSQSRVRSLTFSILIRILWRKPANPMLNVTRDTLCFKLHHLALNANSSCSKNAPLTSTISRSVFTFLTSAVTQILSPKDNQWCTKMHCSTYGVPLPTLQREGAAAQLLLALRPAGWWWIPIHHQMLMGSVHNPVVMGIQLLLSFQLTMTKADTLDLGFDTKFC